MSWYCVFLLLCRICICPGTIFFFSAEFACVLILSSFLQNLHVGLSSCYLLCKTCIYTGPVLVLSFSSLQNLHVGLSQCYLLCRTYTYRPVVVLSLILCRICMQAYPRAIFFFSAELFLLKAIFFIQCHGSVHTGAYHALILSQTCNNNLLLSSRKISSIYI